MNKTQASDLFDFITFLLEQFPYESRYEKLLDIMVNKVRVKIRNKIEQRRPSTGFSITLTEEESLAFEEWMAQLEPVLPKTNYVYEQTFTKQITNDINRTYR